MHQQGRLSEETIRLLLGSVSAGLKSKFEIDAAGMWYNERLEKEVSKRADYVESRRINGSLGGRPVQNHKDKHKVTHKGNHSEDENVNDNIIKDIIGYLNEKIGSNYLPTAAITIKHISARIKEGRTIEDFKKVIDIKSAEWIGTEQGKYLRPETLFGSKFEGYLNQHLIAKTEKQKPVSAFERYRNSLPNE